MVIIKRFISEMIYDGVLSSDNTKDIHKVIGQKIKESTKVEVTNLQNSFSNTRYDNMGGVRNYILKIIQIASKLTELNILMSYDFVLHQVLVSLLMELEQLKVSYNTFTDEQSIDELILVCVQKEDRLNIRELKELF